MGGGPAEGGQLQDKSIFSIFDNVLNFNLNIYCDVIFKLFLFVYRYFNMFNFVYLRNPN